LAAGDLPAGSIVDLTYDGTNFLLELINHGHTGLGDGGHLGQVQATDVTVTGAAASPPDANTLVTDNIPKGWINFKGTGTIAINDTYNVSSIVDEGVGEYTINFDRDFANANYAPVGVAKRLAADGSNIVQMAIEKSSGLSVGSMRVIFHDQNNSAIDVEIASIIAIGDQ
jgi:hypothetical protein